MFNLVRFFQVLFLGLFLAGCSSAPDKIPEAPPSPSQAPEVAQHSDPAPEPKLEGGNTRSPTQPYSAELKTLGPLAVNRPGHFKLRVLNAAGNTVKHKNFRVMHAHRVHALIIDPSLQDYQHIHLRPDDLNGQSIYEFWITPHQPGNYKIFLDVVDLKDRHYFLASTFKVPGKAKPPHFDTSLTKEVEGLRFIAKIDSPIRAKQHLMMDITVKQGDELYRKLEPTMQAYAHLVGFNTDRTQLIHAHPMGEEPRSSNQRGGPNLKFGLEFPRPGNYRLFLQVKVDGKDVFVPFDLNVI